jgi:uncharacterized protein
VQDPAYDPNSPVTPLQPEELAALDQLLQRLPADGAMGLDGLDGYLCALAIGPAALQSLPTAEWLPLVWGGADDEAAASDPTRAHQPFASRRQRKDTVVRVLRHRRHLQHLLQHEPADWEPVFDIAEQGAQEWVDARAWCTGFLQAVDLVPGAWDTARWAEPALQPLLVLGGGLDGNGAGAAQAMDLPQVDELSRAVPDAVLLLTQGRS